MRGRCGSSRWTPETVLNQSAGDAYTGQPEDAILHNRVSYLHAKVVLSD
jgi:hypothetical protein